MFWKITALSASSPVESVLDKEDFTLEELLDEDEIIQECKALNTRLINFLRDPTQVKRLLEYIIDQPSSDADAKITLKFPFVACEIFTCEIEVILKALAENEELLNLLFSFLEPSKKHSPQLAGYFSKVVICLMIRKTVPLMNYVQAHQNVFGELVDLIGITSIMEVLIRLVSADGNVYPNYVDVMQWLADINFLEMIVDKLGPGNPSQVHANAAETLAAIARSSPSPLAAKLSNPSFVSKILGNALADSNSKSSVFYSLSVCISLLDPNRGMASSPMMHSFRHQHAYESPFLPNPETVAAMLPKLGYFNAALSIASDVAISPTTYGELKPPFGKHRLKIVEFIAVLLRTGKELVESKLLSSGTVKRIIDLFFEYPYNNALHHHVESIVLSCLGTGNGSLIDHVLGECDLVGKMLRAERDPFVNNDADYPTVPSAGRKPPRAGNLGYITKISNKLCQLGNVNSQIDNFLQGRTDWIDWRIGVLEERNAVENVNRWACGRPNTLHDRGRDTDEEDAHDRDYDVAALANNLSQAFRYKIYGDDDAEVNSGVDRDDEDAYFDDESAEVVMSSLRLGDDQGSLFTNSNWFAFDNGTKMEEINLGSSGNSGSDDEVVVGEDEELRERKNPNGLVTNTTNEGLFGDQPWVGSGSNHLNPFLSGDSLFEDVEYVGVEMEGSEEGGGDGGALKGSANPTVSASEDGDGNMKEFNDANYWRVDQEVAVLE